MRDGRRTCPHAAPTPQRPHLAQVARAPLNTCHCNEMLLIRWILPNSGFRPSSLHRQPSGLPCLCGLDKAPLLALPHPSPSADPIAKRSTASTSAAYRSSLRSAMVHFNSISR